MLCKDIGVYGVYGVYGVSYLISIFSKSNFPIFVFLEILCPYPDDVVNTNRVDTTRYVGGTSTYTCSLPDRLFLHGNDTTILTCEETGEWSQNITTCERKSSNMTTCVHDCKNVFTCV